MEADAQHLHTKTDVGEKCNLTEIAANYFLESLHLFLLANCSEDIPLWVNSVIKLFVNWCNCFNNWRTEATRLSSTAFHRSLQFFIAPSDWQAFVLKRCFHWAILHPHVSFYLCLLRAGMQNVVRSSAKEVPTGLWLGRTLFPLKPISHCKKEGAFSVEARTSTWAMTCPILDWFWLALNVETAWWVYHEESASAELLATIFFSRTLL